TSRVGALRLSRSGPPAQTGPGNRRQADHARGRGTLTAMTNSAISEGAAAAEDGAAWVWRFGLCRRSRRTAWRSRPGAVRLGLSIAVAVGGRAMGDGADAQTGPEALLENPVAAHSLEHLSSTRDRPLFLQGRRPFAPPPAVVLPPPQAAKP